MVVVYCAPAKQGLLATEIFQTSSIQPGGQRESKQSTCAGYLGGGVERLDGAAGAWLLRVAAASADVIALWQLKVAPRPQHLGSRTSVFERFH